MDAQALWGAVMGLLFASFLVAIGAVKTAAVFFLVWCVVTLIFASLPEE